MVKKFNKKAWILIIIDVASIFLSYVIAAFLRNDDLAKELKLLFEHKDDVFSRIFNPAAAVILVIYFVFFLLFDLYSTLLSHVTLEDAFKITGANVIALALSITYNYTLYPIFSGLRAANESAAKVGPERIPTGVVCIAGVIVFALSLAVRALPRLLGEFRTTYFTKHAGVAQTRTLIYGAGDTGMALLREFSRAQSKRFIVGFFDDNAEKSGQKLNGVRIYGGEENFSKTIKSLAVAEVIIAIPNAKPTKVQKIINVCKEQGCMVKKAPSITEMVEGGKATKLQDVDIADLLGRDEVNLNIEEISGYLKDSVVLVTGGGGSIGSELCRQIIKFEPKKLVILDIYENTAYELEMELKMKYGKDIPVETRIASVRDYKRLTDVFDEIKPDVVFHAAAHKHVPLMEDSPGEAIKNNVFGTYNAATVAHEHNVKTFVLISTDKAVNPTNVMGATKRIAEIIIQAYSKKSNTRFVAVRFGNVLGSNGSVIPLFKKQIAAMGPVTVTDPEITRFFMTIPEAAQLVIQAGAMAAGGEIFILDMGQPVKIDTLARDLIKLSGYIPDVDIKIEYSGLRPGEKLYEELLQAEEGVTAAKRKGFFVAEPFFMDWDGVQGMLSDFEGCINSEHLAVAKTLKKYVPTFNSKDLKKEN